MADKIFLVRHGEAEGSTPGRLLGRTDPGLSDLGWRQAQGLRDLLPSGPDVALLCSPLARARQTGQIASSGVPLIDKDLREIDFGAWEGQEFRELSTHYPKEVELWATSPLDFAFPAGESLLSFWNRVGAVRERLAAIEAGTVVVFTHGGVVRALICRFLGLEFHHYVLFEIGLASVTSLRLREGRGTLLGLRQTSVPAPEKRA